MKFRKTIGWVLLISGLAIIFWTLYSSYSIFTAKTLVPEIFKIEEKEKIPQAQENDTNLEPQEEVRKIIEEQIKETIPPLFLSKILNLITWAMFAGILILGGGKVSSIGIKLIKGE